MPLTLEIVRWIPLFATAVFAVYWGVFLFRIVRARREVPGVSCGLEHDLPDPPPLVSIIVPAHNEEAVIGGCIRQLMAQTYPNLEVIFVLDRCTDQTRDVLREAIAGDPRVRIIENDSCPDDWAGKCHAAWRGAEGATGEWLLFTDADTEFDPQLVRAATGLATQRKLDLLSLLSTLSDQHRFERIVQPVASLHLLRLYPIDAANRDGSRRNFANGQFMLFSRAMYERMGGHVAVKDDLLEDIAFARCVRRHDGRTGLFFDDRMLRCAMFDTFRTFQDGWKRIFIEACKRRPDRLRRHARRLYGLALGEPVAQATLLGLGVWSLLGGSTWWFVMSVVTLAAATAVRLSALDIVYRAAGARRRDALMFHIGALFVGRMLQHAARDLERRSPVRWAGREYILEPRV